MDTQNLTNAMATEAKELSDLLAKRKLQLLEKELFHFHIIVLYLVHQEQEKVLN